MLGEGGGKGGVRGWDVGFWSVLGGRMLFDDREG